MKRINSSYKAEAVRRGLEAEGFIDTPYNRRLQKWSQENKCQPIKAKKGEPHAGSILGFKTTYGQIVGMYEWK